MKQELMSRHRARLRESIAPGNGWGDGDPIGRMIACWIIDIVADAQELALVDRTVVRAPELVQLDKRYRLTYDPKDVTIGDGVGDPRSIERASVTITAEFIEDRWSGALPFVGERIDGAHEHGEVCGRFVLWELTDGSMWAAADGGAVMVVSPVEQAEELGPARLEAVRAFAAAHVGAKAEFETDLARLARTLELDLAWSDGAATVTTAEGQAMVITAG